MIGVVHKKSYLSSKSVAHLLRARSTMEVHYDKHAQISSFLYHRIKVLEIHVWEMLAVLYEIPVTPVPDRNSDGVQSHIVNLLNIIGCDPSCVVFGKCSICRRLSQSAHTIEFGTFPRAADHIGP